MPPALKHTVNSFNRDSGTPSNFTYTLPSSISNFDHVAVTEASIEKSYYMIPLGRNTFIINEEGSDRTITLSIGNYNSDSLATEMALQLQTGKPGGYTYTAAFPEALTEPDDGKMTLTVTGHTLQPILTFHNGYLFELFGFAKDSTNPFVAGTLKSTNVANLAKENNVFLHSDLVGDTGSNNNVLETFYTASTPTFSSIHVINNTPRDTGSILANKGNTASFYLTDERDIPLILNGIDFVFDLYFYNDIPTLFGESIEKIKKILIDTIDLKVTSIMTKDDNKKKKKQKKIKNILDDIDV